jgi:hypothetical protein
MFGFLGHSKNMYIELEYIHAYRQIRTMSNQERDTLRQQWKDGIKDNADSVRTYRLLRHYDRECRQQVIRERKAREQQSNNTVETIG